MEERDAIHPLKTPSNPILRAIHAGYYTGLNRIEVSVVAILLFAVIVLSLIEIISRNLGWHPWDMGANQRAFYGFTFYLGLFGAVLASRQGKHIGIDVASPYLSPLQKNRISVGLFFVGALACMGLSYSAHTFVVDVIDPDAYLVPNQIGSAWWKEQYWRWPMSPAFGLMALHFVVGALERWVHTPPLPSEGGEA